MVFSTADGRFSWWLDTRLYLDAACYLSPANTDLVSSGTDNFRFSNGINPRRIRFAVKANMNKNWFAEWDVDLAYNEVEVKDLYAGYRIGNQMYLKAGHFKEPMSMDRTTSSKYLSFMERPNVVEAFAAGRSLGLSWTGYNRHWWASGGVFGQTIDIDQKDENRGNDGVAATARLAWFPVNDGSYTLHFGGYTTIRTPDANGSEHRSVGFRTFPESRVDRRRFITATVLNVDYFWISGAEFAFKYKKLVFESEYIFNTIKRYTLSTSGVKSVLQNAEFNGFYLSGSYVVWGASRDYSVSEAEFSGGETPTDKKGTLEVAFRYSYLNMNDFHESSPAYWITGGKSTVYTAAINWIPIKNIQLSLNYSFVDHDKWANAGGTLQYDGKEFYQSMPNGLDVNVLQCRIMALF